MAKQIRNQTKERAKPRHYVKEWRKHRGLTQDQLAERIDRSRGLISQFESGETELTEEMVYALADAFRHTPGDVFRVNPLMEGVVVDITDSLLGKPADIQAEALGFVRGLVARK
jgi:transcriptional regulator with XRE-family HTH domain